MTEEELFYKHFPPLNDAEISEAAKEDSIVVSMRGAKRVPDVFVVAFATKSTHYRPMVLTRTTAIYLRRILEQEGF